MIYITTGTTTNIASVADGLLVQVNAALASGTITLKAGTTTFAIITNPTVGSSYRYNGLRGQGAITAVTSASCDVTISLLNRAV